LFFYKMRNGPPGQVDGLHQIGGADKEPPKDEDVPTLAELKIDKKLSRRAIDRRVALTPSVFAAETDFCYGAALVLVGARDGAAALIAAGLWITWITCSSVMRALRSGP
jgi:hypothetical protein